MSGTGSHNCFRVVPPGPRRDAILKRAAGRRRRGSGARRAKGTGIEVFATMEVRPPLAEAAAHARRAERLGYHGLSVPEAVHDGMLVALLCLEHTRELRVATGAIVAFARSPMLVAQGAWDLQRLSGGRFELGLGSQVKGNLEGRFGVAWAPPAPRMRDYVRALRAVFARWQDGHAARVRERALPADADAALLRSRAARAREPADLAGRREPRDDRARRARSPTAR